MAQAAAQVRLHQHFPQVDVPYVFRLEELRGLSLYESSVEEIQQSLSEGHFTSVDFVESCLRRIHNVNPYLECVIEVNPDAIEIAAQLDDERCEVSAILNSKTVKQGVCFGNWRKILCLDAKEIADPQTYYRVKLEVYYTVFQSWSKIIWPQRTKCRQRPAPGLCLEA